MRSQVYAKYVYVKTKQGQHKNREQDGEYCGEKTDGELCNGLLENFWASLLYFGIRVALTDGFVVKDKVWNA